MFGFFIDEVRSPYVKDILQYEFKDKIGFHARPQRKFSELVYYTSDGGSYVEAALTSMGVSSDQLISILLKRIIVNVKETGKIS